MARAKVGRSRAVADRASATAEWLRVAEDAGQLGIWDWDLRAGLLTWSPGMYKLYGIRRAEGDVPMSSFFRRVHPGDRAMLREVTSRVLRRGGSPPRLEFRVVRPDGNVRWVWSSAFVYGYRGQTRRIMGVNIDITDQMRARRQLEQTGDRLRAALRAEGLVVLHQDRRLRYTWVANPGLGLDPQAVLGRRDVDLVDARSARLLTTIKRRVLRTGVGERHQFRLSRGKAEAWFDQFIEPTRGADGRVDGLVSSATDITTRMRAQRALEDSRRRLADLAQHQRDLLEAERTAVARDVHDHVGATLTGVRLKLAALAARHADTGTRAALREVAESVRRAHEATRRICTHLKPVELEDLGLVESCRAYAAEWAGLAGIRLQCRFAPLRRQPPVAVATDAFRAMQELLTNVARHARATNVRVALAERDGRLVLRVADDGRGLPKRARAKGFGLEGLRERVARHGGTLALESSAEGVDARVEIPLRRTA